MYFYDVGYTGTHFLQIKFLDILDSCFTLETITWIDQKIIILCLNRTS